jgi:Nuf2 family
VFYALPVPHAAAGVQSITAHPDEMQVQTSPDCVRREDMRQPVFEAIDELEFPELYDETIPVLTFFQYLRKLMGAAGYHDLSMRVSGRPDCNFWRFETAWHDVAEVSGARGRQALQTAAMFCSS